MFLSPSSSSAVFISYAPQLFDAKTKDVTIPGGSNFQRLRAMKPAAKIIANPFLSAVPTTIPCYYHPMHKCGLMLRVSRKTESNRISDKCSNQGCTHGKVIDDDQSDSYAVWFECINCDFRLCSDCYQVCPENRCVSHALDPEMSVFQHTIVNRSNLSAPSTSPCSSDNVQQDTQPLPSTSPCSSDNVQQDTQPSPSTRPSTYFSPSVSDDFVDELDMMNIGAFSSDTLYKNGVNYADVWKIPRDERPRTQYKNHSQHLQAYMHSLNLSTLNPIQKKVNELLLPPAHMWTADTSSQ